jgi:hypothetical protein
MDRRFIAPILSILLLVASVLPMRQVGAWYCEGKLCGIAQWMCCCDNPDPDCKSGQCAASHSRGAEHGLEIGKCQNDCGCVLVMTSAPENNGAPQSSGIPILDPLLATLDAPVTFLAIPCLSNVLPQLLDARGPPGGRHIGAPSLRGPPFA